MTKKFFPTTCLGEERNSEDDETTETVIARAKLREALGLDETNVNVEMLRTMWRAIPGWVVTIFDAS